MLLARALVIPPRSQFCVLISGNFVDYICLWPVILFSPCCQNQVPELLQVRRSVNQWFFKANAIFYESRPSPITSWPHHTWFSKWFKLESNFFLMLKENRIINKGTWVPKGATWTKWKELSGCTCVEAGYAGKSHCLPLNFVVSIKLILKNSLWKKSICGDSKKWVISFHTCVWVLSPGRFIALPDALGTGLHPG